MDDAKRILGYSLIGGGEAGDIIRRMDWGATLLGPLPDWPVELKANVQTILTSPVPHGGALGPEGVLIYNDVYAEMWGPRHPATFGGTLLEV